MPLGQFNAHAGRLPIVTSIAAPGFHTKELDMLRSLLLSALILLTTLTSPSSGDVVFDCTGQAATGENVHFRATFAIGGDNLTICLENLSPGTPLNPAAVLSSMYFDVVSGGIRPVLASYTATGDVYLTDKNNPDTLQQANANLVATASGDGTWQFKTFNPLLAPFTGFGVSTVGNAGLAPNNFNGNITGSIAFSIYVGDIITQSLHNELLVKDKITFGFTGVSGYSESDIGGIVFGLGTGPDSLLFAIPEPSSLFWVCGLVAVMVGRGRSRR
jgi:hypothetical protein